VVVGDVEIKLSGSEKESKNLLIVFTMIGVVPRWGFLSIPDWTQSVHSVFVF